LLLDGVAYEVAILRASGILLLMCPLLSSAQLSEEAERCAARIENDSEAIHTDADCLTAAEQGYPGILYSVGVGFGFAGDREKELAYYLMAAVGGYVEAYLAIGHVMRSEPINQLDQAVSWYSRYWEEGGYASGYAAKLLSLIESERGNESEAEVWLGRCKETDYGGCQN
jgi:hypothetical protein